MPRVIVFDVNETLLDLAALDPLFTDMFGEPAARRTWFAQVLQSAMTATLTGRYADFGMVGGAAMTMMGTRYGVTVTGEMQLAVAAGMRALPAHADVAPALTRLREAGFRLATLTNNPLTVVEAQLQDAGLSGFFATVLSVGAVREFKPAPAPYRHAAATLGVPIGAVRLVAAHGWDVAGAMAAGSAAAFVARPGQALEPLAPAPDIVGRDLGEVATAIIAVDEPHEASTGDRVMSQLPKKNI